VPLTEAGGDLFGVHEPPSPSYGATSVLEQPEHLAYARSGNRAGVVAGIAGIVALALSWIPFVDYASLFLGAAAIVLGIVGVHRANADPGAGRAMAIVGIASGIAGFSIAAIVLLLIYTVVLTINAATG